jgi:hypothetical protein
MAFQAIFRKAHRRATIPALRVGSGELSCLEPFMPPRLGAVSGLYAGVAAHESLTR